MRTPDAGRFTWHKSSHSSGQGGQCVEVGAAWRKSTYSSGQGGNCVEAGPAWHKSSHSSDQGGNCVEVSTAPEFVGIRDTKNRTQGHLTVSPTTWRTFITSRHVTGN